MILIFLAFSRDKVALVTGGNRGIGLAIAEELVRQGAEVIITSRKPTTIKGAKVISGIEMTDNSCGNMLAASLAGGKKIDILINNAGYFYEPVEKVCNDGLI